MSVLHPDPPPYQQLIPATTWRPAAAAHAARVAELTAGYTVRAQRQQKHPIEDFLFRYYNTKPAQLARFHPGVTARLEGAAAEPIAAWRHYRTYSDGSVGMDVPGFLRHRGAATQFIHDLLRSIAGNPAQFDCFGLHEWAMVYHLQPDEIRHEQLPLRLSSAATDAVVDAHRITCTHCDAFRFFTPDARPLNTRQPVRASQPQDDQPGCLHANMDLYKWALKLTPVLPSQLVGECFTLARRIRLLDMVASPYDLTDYGHDPIAVETAAGKAEYVRQQREFAAEASALRARVIDACALILALDCGNDHGVSHRAPTSRDAGAGHPQR